MKLMLHELAAAIECVSQDKLGSAFKMLARVSKIMEQLCTPGTCSRTMTRRNTRPIRPTEQQQRLQSWQYARESSCSATRTRRLLKPHSHRPEILERVEKAYRAPSLYDESCACSHGAHGDSAEYVRRIGRSLRWQRTRSAGLARATAIRTNTGIFTNSVRTDRSGRRRSDFGGFVTSPPSNASSGSSAAPAGTSGVGYLRKMLDVVLFPEIWKLRTDL